MLENKIVELLTQLQDSLTKYTPMAFELLKSLVRIQAIGSLSLAFVYCIAVGIYLLCVVKPTFRYHAPKKIDDPYADHRRRHGDNARFFQIGEQWFQKIEWEDLSIAKCFVGALLSVIGVVVFLSVVGNVWNWIAVFDPSLAVAHNIALQLGVLK